MLVDRGPRDAENSCNLGDIRTARVICVSDLLTALGFQDVPGAIRADLGRARITAKDRNLIKVIGFCAQNGALQDSRQLSHVTLPRHGPQSIDGGIGDRHIWRDLAKDILDHRTEVFSLPQRRQIDFDRAEAVEKIGSEHAF